MICKQLQIEQRISTAYHPETDGSIERANQEVETYLRKFVTYEQDDWIRWIPIAQIAINNKQATSTQISPFFMSHGYNAEEITINMTSDIPTGTPASRGQVVVNKLREAHDFAQASMVVAQQSQEKYANQKREASLTYRFGDKVWLNLKNVTSDRPSKKLDWIHAKFSVTKTFPHSANFYELDTSNGIHNRFQASLLRPANDNPLSSQKTDDIQPQGLQMMDGDIEYGIDEILQVRTRKIGRGKRKEALVKWTGYAITSWHPLDDFQDTIALDIFENKYGIIES